MTRNKKEKTPIDPTLYNSQMTLKPTKKIRRKNKKTRLQVLWEEGKATSQEFYEELTRFIKSRLMQDLIRRGYYINRVRQTNFTRDECDSCYTHVLHKVLTGYSPEKGTIATYIRWQIRGWGQLIIQKQVRKHKYNPKGTVSLDNTNIYNVKLEEYRNSCKCPEDIEEILDESSFKGSIFDNLTKDEVESIRKQIEIFGTTKTNFEWFE